jgi:hypothetical protein
VFFFEKKNQKTFACCVRFRRVRDSTTKSLLALFSQKRKTFALSAAASG